MKRISILLFALAIALSSQAQTYKFILLKNAGAADTSYVDGKAWYNPTYNHFTFIEGGVAKHISTSSGLTTTLNAAHIFVGNVSNVATDVALSGDATLSSSGALSIGAGKVTNSMLAGSISYSKLNLTGSILNADLAGSIDATKINTGVVSNTEFNYLDGVTGALQTQIDGKQPLDSDLTTIAGLTATTDNFLVSVSSAWASRTPAQVKTTLSLNNVENTALSTWAGSTNLTTLGMIGTGTWNGSSISTTYTDAKIKTVTGTTNRLSIGGTSTDPTFDISSSYVGQNTITTLGTIGTGTWNGTVIGLAYGGTNANLTASNGGIFYSTSSAGAILSGTATANKILLSGSSAAPSWSTSTIPSSAGSTANKALISDGTNYVLAGVTEPNSATTGDVVYASSSNVYSNLAANSTATNKYLQSVSSGVPSWQQISFSDLSNQTNAYLTASGGTATSANTFTHNFASELFTNTWTASANSQVSRTFTDAITLRATASDAVTATYFNPSLTLSSTTQNPVGLNLDVTYVQSGLATTTVAGTSTLAGMTATTYTGITPASSSQGGTGVYTVVVSNATTISSITATSGTNKVMETITFNGSQFGSGSGSVTYTIRAVSGISLGTSASALRVGTTGSYSLDAPKAIDIYYQGSTIGQIGTDNVVGGQLGFYDATSLNFRISNASGAIFAKPILASSTATVVGNFQVNNTATSSFLYNTGALGSTSALLASGTVGGITATNTFQSKYKTTGTVADVGHVNTVSLTTGGTGYTTGVKTTTGGTGSGASIQINTVSGGVIQTITTTVASTGQGSNYVVGDVLTLSGGTGGTVTVTAVDFAGSIQSFEDFNSITDAKSNNTYTSFYSRPVYNITSTQTGATWFAYYNPTYTALGSFTKGGIAIVPTGTLSTIGGSTYDATLKLIGAGSNATFKTVGAGTGTNKSLDAYQSDGTTSILFLKDNGDFQVGLSSSKWGMFGTSAVAQQSVLGILVNNVTSGGTTSTIADFTDLSTYSTDAPTIRNDIYQLAKKQLAIETALRNYGILKD